MHILSKSSNSHNYYVTARLGLADWLKICRYKYSYCARYIIGQPLPIKPGSKLKVQEISESPN